MTSYQAIADRARHANLGYRDGVTGTAADIEERIATLDKCIRSYGTSLAFLSERLSIADPDGVTVPLVGNARQRGGGTRLMDYPRGTGQMPGIEQRVSEMEDELGRTAALVGEIVDARKSGDFDTTHGNGDDDLLAAVEEFEFAVKDWRNAR